MSFDFYSQLSPDKRGKYDLMLDTHYILLMCDLGLFQEENEYHKKILSASWIYSMHDTLKVFGLNPDSYPHGSISANRLYYEVLKNYSKGLFPSGSEYSIFRKGLINFLKLRRDDNSPTDTKMFGSSYTLKNSSSRENKLYRQIDINIRHSATALCILCEESEDVDTSFIKSSFLTVYNRIDDFINNKQMWNGDEFEHLTLSSTINFCNSFILKSKDEEIIEKANELKQKSEHALLEECLTQDEVGAYYWKLPQNHKMTKYEFYLTFFSLIQVKHLLSDERIRSLLKRILCNIISTNKGKGLPIYPIDQYDTREIILPDFGTTGAMLYLLFYIIDNKLGDNDWLDYCKNNFNELLNFCLNVFDDPKYYHLSASENHAKILLLPHYNYSEKRLHKLNDQIIKIKGGINKFLDKPEGNYKKEIEKINIEEEFTYIINLLKMWNLSYNDNNKKYDDKLESYPKLGAFAGAFISSAVKVFFDI